jgi:hypothetical protein
MRIIDTFQFSEPFEREVLLTKLNVGSEIVSEWLICENSYTHQGEFKGHFVKKILESDRRFEPFLDRVKVFEGDWKGVDITRKEGVNDPIAISNEVNQRQLSRNYILSNYHDEDFVLLSDCDECPDFSNSSVRDVVFKRLRQSRTDIVKAPRIRFWYDVDNLWLEPRATPFVSVRLLRTSERDFCDLRYSNLFREAGWGNPVVFEYSFNFCEKDILRKYSSFIHTGFSSSEVRMAILCNHLPVSSSRGQKINLDSRWWLKNVQLDEKNSPSYVRENFEKLRTRTVNPNYLEERYLYYPEFYSRELFSFATYNRAKAETNNAVRLIRQGLRKAAVGTKMSLGFTDHK